MIVQTVGRGGDRAEVPQAAEELENASASSSRSRRGPFGSGRPRSASSASLRSPIVRWPVLSGSRLSHGRGGALGSACLTSSHWRRIAADPQHQVRGLPRQLDDLVLRLDKRIGWTVTRSALIGYRRR
jgi:hypothetical protein